MTTSAGTKVVPTQPTTEMAAAAHCKLPGDLKYLGFDLLRTLYRAMLAAAPSSPAQAGELVHNLKFAHGVLVELTKQAIDAQAPTVLIGTGIANRAIVLIEQASAEIERLSALKPAAVMRRDLQTGINHRHDPHCIGCWHIQAADKTINANINAVCNECGEVRDITLFLEKVDAGSAEPVAWLVVSNRGITRCAWTDEPTEETMAVCKYDGDTVTPLYTHPPAPKTAWIDAATVERNSRPAALKVSDSAHGAKHIARLQRRADALQARLDASPQQADFADERAELKSLQWAIEALELAGRK